MSSRLFTEVREKLGLVYYVSAWSEHPRGAGMIHLAASTTPQRCDETYATMLREVSRLAEDLTDDELERAKTGILARAKTRGEMTSSRCAEISNDLVHYGRPVPVAEKLEAVLAVTVEDVVRYLNDHPRDRLSVVTLGPKQLEA
jgi:predicted Zn-dependent peptidase